MTRTPPGTPVDSRSASTAGPANPAGPPTKHQLAVMIWVVVFPTLTILNVTLAPYLSALGPVARTFILATIAVPIVIYGLMPQLHKLRAVILIRHRT